MTDTISSRSRTPAAARHLRRLERLAEVTGRRLVRQGDVDGAIEVDPVFTVDALRQVVERRPGWRHCEDIAGMSVDGASRFGVDPIEVEVDRLADLVGGRLGEALRAEVAGALAGGVRPVVRVGIRR